MNPLVSCIMVTTPKRSMFRRQAQRYFDRQTYSPRGPERIPIPNDELFIVVSRELGHTWDYLPREWHGTPGGEAVNLAVANLPDYPKGLRECVSEEDLGFYEGLREQ